MKYELKTDSIQKMIYEIRGQQVMLDSDLARLFNCKNGTKDVNKAVKRNTDRFPEDFYFQLSNEECKTISRFQNGTLKRKQGQNIKYLPFVFTEEGVAQLASILHTEIAAQMSVAIMRAFVFLRHYVEDDLLDQKYYNNLTLKNNLEIKELQNSFNSFKEDKEVDELYFDGKIYDAYSKIIDIFKEANNKLIIIDRFIDKTILDMIKNLKCDVILITGSKSNLSKLDINKYRKTYDNLSIYYSELFHDRYFIIDDKKIYHSGNSINHMGYRKSSIDVLYDSTIKEIIIEDVYKILNHSEN